jgi:hypothetical protein
MTNVDLAQNCIVQITHHTFFSVNECLPDQGDLQIIVNRSNVIFLHEILNVFTNDSF